MHGTLIYTVYFCRHFLWARGKLRRKKTDGERVSEFQRCTLDWKKNV